MTKSEINEYAMRISQASRSEIIVIMYEVAIKYIDDGVLALQDGNVQDNVMVKADITLKTDDLIRVKGMLDRLHSAFVEVSRQDSSQPMMRNVQQVYTGLTYSKNSLNDSYASVSDFNRGYKV